MWAAKTQFTRNDVWAPWRRHPLVIAYFAALLPALVMAVTQPVWSRIDEAPNADFIVQLSHGVYPVADTTLVDPETVQVLEAEGFFTATYPAASGPPMGPAPDPTETSPIPPGMSDRVNAIWMARHMWELSRESDQTPAYFALMAPVWWVVDRLGGHFAAIYVIRIIGALLIATLAPMAVSVARILTPTRPEVSALAALFAILLPGLNLNGTRISNDALAIALGGLFVLLAVRWAGSAWTWRRAVLMGLLLGAGLMVKLTLIGLFPALALAVLWPAAGSDWRGRLARLLLSGAIASACLGPWLLLNLHNYGAILPGARIERLLDAVPGSITVPWITLDLAVVEFTYWTGEPWGVLPLALPFAVLGGVLALTVPMGVISLVRARGASVSTAPLAVATVALGGMIVVALTLLPASFRLEVVGAGRYAYPAVPAAAALVAIGISTVLRNAFTRRTVVTLYALAAVGMLGAGALGLPAKPVLELGPGTPPPNARMVSVTASGDLEGVTISVNRIAFDPGAKATWFEVTMTNSTPVEVDWPVVPVASVGDEVFNVEYLKSTRLPSDIDAGQTVTGWLFVALDPSGVHGSDHVLLRFQDVAVDNYRTVQDVDVLVDIGTSGATG